MFYIRSSDARANAAANLMQRFAKLEGLAGEEGLVLGWAGLISCRHNLGRSLAGTSRGTGLGVGDRWIDLNDVSVDRRIGIGR